MASFKLGKIQYSFTETVTAAGTLVLTSSSKMFQVFTGTANHTVQLPDATTMGAGVGFVIANNSTGIITVNNNSSIQISTVAAGASAEFLPTDITTANGVWRTYSGSSGASAATGLLAKGPGTVVGPAQIALFMGGSGPLSTIDAYSFASGGTAATFGSLITARGAVNGNGCSSSTRATVAGGFTSSVISSIEYVQFSTISNAASFGNLTQINENFATMSSATRGVIAAGYTGSAKISNIEYITLATLGNGTNFGTVASGGHRDPAGFASTTRGVFGGDNSGSASGGTQIDYITIATTGNSTSFGVLSVSRGNIATGSNVTRGIFAGGESSARSNLMEYVTIATAANSLTFGNLSVAYRYASGAASPTIFTNNGGNLSTGDVSTVEYVTIATTGNSANFGNLTVARNQVGGCSNCHGGL